MRNNVMLVASMIYIGIDDISGQRNHKDNSMFSVVHDGEVLDVVCRKHPAAKMSPDLKNWYVVYVGETFLGEVVLMSPGWKAICRQNPQNNWMANGYATRRFAIEFMLRNSDYWTKDI